MTEQKKMAKEVIVGWDEAVENSFVKLEEDKEKILEITNWKLVKAIKFGKETVEFQADVVSEDDKPLSTDKQFTTVSNRLKTKLRDLLIDKQRSDIVKIKILCVNAGFDRQYVVKLVPRE